ncbi:MAG: hypothetical protein CMO40_08530 [Verrucomicrobiaceae bacterium]|nr:hypothetical protein [Verrucomicrobiaceae bacterium]
MMRNQLLQLVISGAALGIMCGAVVVHSLHVSGAERLAESGHWSSGVPSSLELQGESPVLPAAFGTEPVDRGHDPQMIKGATTLEALQEIVERLREMKSENQDLHGVIRDLREQGAETNRDLSELQFRVDSHSQSFRPMRFSSEAGSILQNSITPGSKLHPLLPPKE